MTTRVALASARLRVLGAVSSGLPKPNGNNTGVPPGTTLTPAASVTGAWFTRNSSSGYPRFIVTGTPPGGIIDSIDFTDYIVTVNTPSDFRKCKFAAPTILVPTSRPFFLNQHNSGAIGVGVAATKYSDCTFDGNTTDTHWPVTNSISNGGLGAQTPMAIEFYRCNIFGFNDGLETGNWDGFVVEACYIHDLIIDKHTDSASGYTNPANWLHSDAIQFLGYYTRNGRIQYNNLSAVELDGSIGNSAGIQCGAFTANGADITNILFDSNWCDGADDMFNANLSKTVTATNFVVTNNRYGLNVVFAIRSASFNTLVTTYATNVWALSGTTLGGITATRGSTTNT